MSSRLIGDAQRTADGNESARRLSKAYRKQRNLPDAFTETEMEGENLCHYISAMCVWASNQAIPRYFDENLQPENPDNKRGWGKP